MIPVHSEAAFEAGLAELRAFNQQHAVRGRFVALYLGLRLMGDRMAPLGSVERTTASEIQAFLDLMWTKTHRAPPLNVLTAPFGRGGPNSGYSTVTGMFAPGNSTATNTWRNNLGIQKGVGCVASPELIAELTSHEDPRAACPHFVHDGHGHVCALSHPAARYRGEKQAIWLARSDAGFQVVNLDEPSAFEPYLRPGGARIPVYALLAALYCFAPLAVYPVRREVTVAEFESDFGFPPGFVDTTFDCDPNSPANARTINAADVSDSSSVVDVQPRESAGVGAPLPMLPEQVILNSGIQAEITVGLLFEAAGWTVFYTAGQQGLGYDLRVESGHTILHIEVKSSVGFVRPVLTASEWKAANTLGESFILAVVDFVGSDRQTIHFVHHPARSMSALERTTVSYVLPRDLWEGVAVPEVPTST
ncbi:MAG: DUF3883 domain-containing protein [Microbacterium sp.]|uniref:protein NO VEIN domain-containing protein n=1 Tax=Microbacterium sp. TaxID=51671 RepID=UPI001D991A6E|nr:DUF3883 domain-containing protein [Microbacterium sp.]MBW8762483.1 DUF3883 domain-containing protein [Microbacterium sp.]